MLQFSFFGLFGQKLWFGHEMEPIVRVYEYKMDEGDGLRQLCFIQLFPFLVAHNITKQTTFEDTTHEDNCLLFQTLLQVAKNQVEIIKKKPKELVPVADNETQFNKPDGKHPLSPDLFFFYSNYNYLPLYNMQQTIHPKREPKNTPPNPFR